MSTWGVYKGNQEPHDGVQKLPDPPTWRRFGISATDRGATFRGVAEEIELVNAALYLRRPLLLTGDPGSGKSSLPYAVAHELKLGRILRWPITSRSTLAEGLYQYDAIGRLQEANFRKLQQDGSNTIVPDIGRYIRLGPLGTAMLSKDYPRVLLIDEIDKSDIDLPNDLLNIFEEGVFEIPELVRLPQEFKRVEVLQWDSDTLVPITNGRVECQKFPFVVLTSNGEREFPPAFLRRCLRLDIPSPNEQKLQTIITAHLGTEGLDQAKPLIEDFIKRRNKGELLATDQLLNAVYMAISGVDPLKLDRETLLKSLLRSLSD